jgi:hypothetical protein
MSTKPPGQTRVVVIFIGLLATAIALLVIGKLREEDPELQPRTTIDAGVASVLQPFPALLKGLEPDGGALLDTTVRRVEWHEGDCIVLHFERLEAPPTTLEVRRFDASAPAPLAHSASLAVYVVAPPDSGTAARDEQLATALGEFLVAAEREGRPIPQLLPLR